MKNNNLDPVQRTLSQKQVQDDSFCYYFIRINYWQIIYKHQVRPMQFINRGALSQAQ
jgi:hypothetical protein